MVLFVANNFFYTPEGQRMLMTYYIVTRVTLQGNFYGDSKKVKLQKLSFYDRIILMSSPLFDEDKL